MFGLPDFGNRHDPKSKRNDVRVAAGDVTVDGDLKMRKVRVQTVSDRSTASAHWKLQRADPGVENS